MLEGKTYSSDNLLDKVGETSVHVIRDHAHGLLHTGLDVAGHVLLQHRLDNTSGVLVALEDGLATEQTGLLGGVPVEFNGVGLVAGRDGGIGEQDAHSLKDSEGTAAIVISTGSTAGSWAGAVDAILVRADDNSVCALSGDSGDDAVLGPGWVAESADGHFGVGGCDLLDLLEEPFGRLLAVCALVVAVLEVGEGGELALHVGGAELGEKWIHAALLGYSRREDDACLSARKG